MCTWSSTDKQRVEEIKKSCSSLSPTYIRLKFLLSISASWWQWLRILASAHTPTDMHPLGAEVALPEDMAESFGGRENSTKVQIFALFSPLTCSVVRSKYQQHCQELLQLYRKQRSWFCLERRQAGSGVLQEQSALWCVTEVCKAAKLKAETHSIRYPRAQTKMQE